MVKSDKPQYRQALLKVSGSDYPSHDIYSHQTVQGILQGYENDGYDVDTPVLISYVREYGEVPEHAVLLYFARLKE